MKTQRLYLEDAYIRRFDAMVVSRGEVDGRPAVVLDRTAFYPTGGGQPHDRGSLNGVAVVDVQERETGPVHILGLRLETENVSGEVDWARRFDHMQQHSGQHVLSQSCIQQLRANTVGFHLGPTHCTIDLDRMDLTVADLDSVERQANQVIAENRVVASKTVAADEATRARVRGKTELLTSVRLVEVEDFDLSGCGGTHVRSTAEIGTIKVLNVERHRGGTSRVSFLCGRRALEDYSRKHEVVRELVHILTTGEEDIIETVQAMKVTDAVARKRVKRLRQVLVEREAASLLSVAKTVGQSRMVSAVYREFPWDADSVRTLAALIAQDPNAVALLGWSGDKTQLTFARGAQAHGHMGTLMKMACALLDGRGGGRPDWAQGGSACGAELELVLEQVESAWTESAK